MARKKKYQWQDGALTEQGESLSRSAKKRQSLALQAMGEELSRLSPADWQELPLGPDLTEALTMYARITDREGRRRQMQYIGRLMREIDAAPLRAALDARANATAADTVRFHQAEQWRQRLLEIPANALEDEIRQLLAQAAASGPVSQEAAQRLRELTAVTRKAHMADKAQHMPAASPQYRTQYRALFRVIKDMLSPADAKQDA